MFDLAATDGTVRKKAYKSPIPDGGEAPAKGRRVNKLDGEGMVRMHHRLLDYYTTELDRQHNNRAQQAEDEAYYDNEQWDEEDADEVRDRGQVPLVYNVISASIDWVTGTERRARTDFKVLPRRKTDGKSAERKTQLLKYLSDTNREPFHISRAFEDQVKVGLGWIEDGVRDDSDDEPTYTRYESWRNMLWDSASTELDLSDARYVFRSKWADLDIAQALFRNRKALLERSAADSDAYSQLDQYGDDAMDDVENAIQNNGQSTTSARITGYQRRRVRLIEGWIMMPVETKRIRGGPFNGEIYDQYSRAHGDAVARGEAELITRMTMRMHVAIFTTAGMLWFSESPYRHNRFPFTPLWGYRRGKDNMPYGMIRRLKDIQQDINKRASKALHILSTSKIIMDEDAIPDDMTVEEFLEEASRPDALIRKKRGSEVTLNADRDLSQYHLELMSRSIAMVQQASGVTDELLGRRTNATSGVAIQRRQDQGSMATARFFDNLLLANQIHGEKLLANTEQYFTEEKTFRITNMRGKAEFIDINDGLPDNDITRSKADFIMSEGAFHASMRQAAAEQLMDVMTRMSPELAVLFMDLVIENMDLPNREELVKRIRAVTGMADPDAEEPTEEEMQRQSAQQQGQQMQQALLSAQLRKAEAEATKAEAQAAELREKIVALRVGAQQQALGAAQTAIAFPAATHVADHILAGSGFISVEDAAAASQQPMAAAPPPDGKQYGLMQMAA
ncbi:portal protein [Aminobacter sp. MDW-2]|uniref:portal protein n=1 Tax=Aminobacter sp. MDW-2 TaxID=2666139 RepID=UPI0012B013C1|nr:portal protein [Aminobacter sp. MDW-2]MRX32816.1 hypothetical protein [Aminobacter sp. MDW-2]QNH34525.1 hypothetical protein H5P29_00795 [Aminobacter sp. MDW-2]